MDRRGLGRGCDSGHRVRRCPDRDCDLDYGSDYDLVRDCDSDYGSGHDHVAARGQPLGRTMRPALVPVAVESPASVSETEFVTAT